MFMSFVMGVVYSFTLYPWIALPLLFGGGAIGLTTAALTSKKNNKIEQKMTEFKSDNKNQKLDQVTNKQEIEKCVTKK